MEQELHDAEHLMDHIGANVKDYSVRYGILEMRHMEAEREYRPGARLEGARGADMRTRAAGGGDARFANVCTCMCVCACCR